MALHVCVDDEFAQSYRNFIPELEAFKHYLFRPTQSAHVGRDLGKALFNRFKVFFPFGVVRIYIFKLPLKTGRHLVPFWQQRASAKFYFNVFVVDVAHKDPLLCLMQNHCLV